MFFPRIASTTYALVLLLASLAMIFAGRWIIRAIAFITIGLVFGFAGATFGATILGPFGLFLGGILGFIVGGLLSLVLLPLAIGLGTGYIAYSLFQSFVHVYIFSIIVGLIFFVIGIILSSKLLALATAFLGALLLADVLIFFHVPSLIAVLAALVLGAVGFFVQGGFRNRQRANFVSWSSASPPANAVRVGSQRATQYCPHCGARIDSSDAASFCPNCGSSLRS